MFACIHGKNDLKAPGAGSQAPGGRARLTALAFEFSPTVEQTADDTVTFDASGLDRLFGLPQEIAAAVMRRAGERGLRINLAMAANPDAAICAARGFTGSNVIPQGDEAKFLGSLPVAQLAPSPELAETLERWGIRRFQDLAALPPLGIAERLGPEGLKLHRLARGEVERKLMPLEDPQRFEDQIEPDYPIELLEPLLFLLARLLEGVTTHLATRALATNELRLALKLEPHGVHERVLRLPVPSLDSKAFLKLMHLDLTAHPPHAPVVHVRLEANPVKPQSAQTGLYIPLAPEPVKLELTLARIKAIVGEDRVGTVELVDSWRPEAFRKAGMGDRGWGMGEGHAPRSIPYSLSPIPAFSFRLFRPPRAAHVVLSCGHPSFLAADGIRGKVVELAGPWRSSGDWWTVDAWSRDEWDIALSDGALYRLYCCPAGWFVEGSYD
jgi:protein ImuB